MELNVETKRPNIEYNLRGIIEEMLECGQTHLNEMSSYSISFKVGDEEGIKEIVTGELEVSITVPEKLLEKIRSNL